MFQERLEPVKLLHEVGLGCEMEMEEAEAGNAEKLCSSSGSEERHPTMSATTLMVKS